MQRMQGAVVEKGSGVQPSGVPKVPVSLQDQCNGAHESSFRRWLDGTRSLPALHGSAELQGDQAIQGHAIDVAVEDWCERGCYLWFRTPRRDPDRDLRHGG